jgi:hypothetical protein
MGDFPCKFTCPRPAFWLVKINRLQEKNSINISNKLWSSNMLEDPQHPIGKFNYLEPREQQSLKSPIDNIFWDSFFCGKPSQTGIF